MIIKTVKKKLNKTESGNSGTNDTYVSMNAQIKGFFDQDELRKDLCFNDLTTNNEYILKATTPGNEVRLTKIGQYLREKETNPGDEIILQKKINFKDINENVEKKTEFLIDIYKYPTRIVLDCTDKESLEFISKFNEDRLENLLGTNNSQVEIKIKNLEIKIKIKRLDGLKKLRTQSYKRYTVEGIEDIFDDFKQNKLNTIIVQKNENEAEYEIMYSCNSEFSTIEI